MSNLPDNAIARRQFLRGAAGLVGATVVGSSSAVAQVIGGTRGVSAKPILGAPTYSIGFWDGVSFTLATSLDHGDSTLTNVNVSLKGFGSVAGLNAVDAMFAVSGAGQVPFQAWNAGPSGCKSVDFTMPVSTEGVTFNLHLASGDLQTTSSITLVPGADKGPKLRAGVYVVIPGTANWNTLTYTPTLPNTPLTTADGFPANVAQYLVVTIDPM